MLLGAQADEQVQINVLKSKVAEFAAKIEKEEDFERIRGELKTLSLLAKRSEDARKAAAEAAAAPAPEAKA